MAATKKTTKPETAKLEDVEPEVVATEGIPYDKLSDELRAIYDEAEAIEAEMSAEFRKKTAKITATMLAYYKTMTRTGKNASTVFEKVQALSTDEPLEDQMAELKRVGDSAYGVVEATVGKHLAATFLKELDGEKIGFSQILQDVFRLAKVGKA